MAKTTPVLFFAFANDRAVEKRYLRNLPEEERRLREAVDKARRAGRCQVEVRYNATPDTVWNVFLDPELKGRIAIFHFAGHAGGTEILLETREGAAAQIGAEGLASFLGLQEGLQAVFLNGCSTEPQVQALLAAGVPVVIATSRAIGDRVATEFSTRFYQSLAAGAPLGIAFQEAVHLVRSQSPAPPQGGLVDDWPWTMHGEDSDKAWKISRAPGVPPLSGETVEIPPLLPYLCDREEQETPLGFGIATHRRERPHRPLVVLIHGEHRQALERFIDRLQDPTLPIFLRREPLLRKGPLMFLDTGHGKIEERLEPLRRLLGEALCRNPEAELTALAQGVVECRSPVMVDINFQCEEDQPGPDAKLLSTWLAWLARWPEIPMNQDLIFLLRFGYCEPASPPLLFWRRPSRRVERLLRRITRKRPAGLGVVDLEPLGNIREAQVRDWIEQRVRPFIRREIGQNHEISICERLKKMALELFRTRPSLPMEDLAPQLHEHLRESLRQGGV
jgi:hypothetical protein